MTIINLREFYPWYTKDELVEVSDEVAEELRAGKRYENAYRHRVRYNKAYYSLDVGDGIETAACQHEPTPQELLERVELFYHLWNALNILPEKEGRRVDAHIILGMTYREIGKKEGVNYSSVRCSVLCGLQKMKRYLQQVWF